MQIKQPDITPVVCRRSAIESRCSSSAAGGRAADEHVVLRAVKRLSGPTVLFLSSGRRFPSGPISLTSICGSVPPTAPSAGTNGTEGGHMMSQSHVDTTQSRICRVKCTYSQCLSCGRRGNGPGGMFLWVSAPFTVRAESTEMIPEFISHSYNSFRYQSL